MGCWFGWNESSSAGQVVVDLNHSSRSIGGGSSRSSQSGHQPVSQPSLKQNAKKTWRETINNNCIKMMVFSVVVAVVAGDEHWDEHGISTTTTQQQDSNNNNNNKWTNQKINQPNKTRHWSQIMLSGKERRKHLHGQKPTHTYMGITTEGRTHTHTRIHL